jgi:hypothetical protein
MQMESKSTRVNEVCNLLAESFAMDLAISLDLTLQVEWFYYIVYILFSPFMPTRTSLCFQCPYVKIS